MLSWLRYLFGWILGALGSRSDLVLENLALREQLLALHAKRPHRRLSPRHKLFWVGLRRLRSGWQKPLVLVTPRTVIAWHQAGFRRYWKFLSRTQRTGGRPPTRRQIRELISRMAAENPTWGGSRIQAELRMLGFKSIGTHGVTMAPENAQDPEKAGVGGSTPSLEFSQICCLYSLYEWEGTINSATMAPKWHHELTPALAFANVARFRMANTGF
jgi:hypothetical protein